MEIIDFLKNEDNIIERDGLLIMRKRIQCRDGFSMSVQASVIHHCVPAKNLKDGKYEKVEVGSIFTKEHLLDPYTENKKDDYPIYPFVPIKVVEKIIKKHGGIIEQ